jgi:hypothetical protein
MGEDDLKGQVRINFLIKLKIIFRYFKNNVLSKKVDDLRAKLAEECQKTETFKMDVRKFISYKNLYFNFTYSIRCVLKQMN